MTEMSILAIYDLAIKRQLIDVRVGNSIEPSPVLRVHLIAIPQFLNKICSETALGFSGSIDRGHKAGNEENTG